MNGKLIVLGNGFDLFCGLKTSYKDFFNSSSYSDKLKQCNFIYQDWSHFCSGLKRTTTIWDYYFYCYSELHHWNNNNIFWCDIEKAMADSFFFEPQQLRCLWGQILSDLKTTSPFGKQKDIKILMECYIWNYCRLDFRNISISDFYTWVLDELNSFENAFGQYVKTECMKNSFQTIANSLINQIALDESPNGFIIDTIIETFNYSTLSSSNFNLHNVNGDYNHPIFGISSIRPKSQFEINDIPVDDERYQFTKTSRQVKQLAFLQNQSSRGFNTNKDVYIYGHSLNVQDYGYFFSLFDWIGLTNTNLNKKLVFCYSKHESNALKDSQDISKYQHSIERLVEAYGNIKNSNNKSYLMDSLISNDVLQIAEIVKKPIGGFTIIRK
jgi:hypothetical protein